MQKRGRILRDTQVGDGLVSIDGRQYPFRLEGMWRSEFAPRINGMVEAEFDEHGNLISLRGLDASTIAGEQATQAMDAAQTAAKKLAGNFQSQGLPFIRRYAQHIGCPVLAGFAAVVLGWFFLPFLSAEIPFGPDISATFYQTLKLSNAGAGTGGIEALTNVLDRGGSIRGSSGFIGLLCFLALALVFLPQVWKDRRAAWGLFAPLAVFALAMVVVYWRVSSLASAGLDAAGDFGGAEFRQMAKEMAREAAVQMRQAISIGSGLWLSLVGVLLLAWAGWKSSANDPRT
ncbi:MAG: hypothetical protein H7A15_03545 [Sinobacteraceae bacterium]|nr:hypothetical protein [Nevskiaceae bacterium]